MESFSCVTANMSFEQNLIKMLIEKGSFKTIPDSLKRELLGELCMPFNIHYWAKDNCSISGPLEDSLIDSQLEDYETTTQLEETIVTNDQLNEHDTDSQLEETTIINQQLDQHDTNSLLEKDVILCKYDPNTKKKIEYKTDIDLSRDILIRIWGSKKQVAKIKRTGFTINKKEYNSKKNKSNHEIIFNGKRSSASQNYAIVPHTVELEELEKFINEVPKAERDGKFSRKLLEKIVELS